MTIRSLSEKLFKVALFCVKAACAKAMLKTTPKKSLVVKSRLS